MNFRREYKFRRWEPIIHFQTTRPFFVIGFNCTLETCGGFLEVQLFGATLYMDCYRRNDPA
jgi:hypothetical protein